MARPENKDFILQKTFFLLISKGCDSVSITDVQKETSMSRGIIYHYYKDKDELFRAASEKFLFAPYSIQIAETKGFTIPDMIRHAVNKYYDLSKKWQNYAGDIQISIAKYEFLFYQMIQKDKKLEKTYYLLRQEERKAWKEAVLLSLSKGEIRLVLSAESITTHFMLLVDGTWSEAQESGSISQYAKLTKKALNDYYDLIKV